MLGPGGIVYVPGGYFVPTGWPALLLSLLLWAWILAGIVRETRLAVTRTWSRRHRAADGCASE